MNIAHRGRGVLATASVGVRHSEDALAELVKRCRADIAKRAAQGPATTSPVAAAAGAAGFGQA